ncbi:uncharacterized protein FIBRA_01597 [Fibroporia radiculosa]|uniref:Uncharacterized protein n=1 Tax=Fibroporia radiculosa TaxID=599839 RepID=J4H1A9_9APHY|nr:uncharacterized protein FIBRA_01597 [Fibroporia radiculosa]CCL99579.1 predicted protein [Fibroporia radiculosa]
MVDWQSEAEIAQDSAAFDKFMHTLLGLYIWEFVTSLPFDWAFISGKKKFRWPMIFYFAGRYFLLFALIGIAIALNVTVFGNASIGLASINLSLRTIAVWSQNPYIVGLLVCVILGHWSLLLHGILIKAAWIPGSGCAITDTNNRVLAATFIYSMAFDFLVLTLTAWKLAIPRRREQSRIVQLIFGDGLIFFIIAFLSNLLATIFMMLDLNAVMSIIANVPAAIASTIVACRAVRRLSNYTSPGAEVFGSTVGSTIAFSRGMRTRGGPSVTIGSTDKKDGVHVQMETFAAVSDPLPTNFVRYDVTGKIVTSDIESDASPIDEYKHAEY